VILQPVHETSYVSQAAVMHDLLHPVEEPLLGRQGPQNGVHVPRADWIPDSLEELKTPAPEAPTDL
jgi:hypothetical protein